MEIAAGDGQYMGVAVAGGALVVVAALYLLGDKCQTTRVPKHWEEVCRRTLERRNNLQHKVSTQRRRYQQGGRHGLGVTWFVPLTKVSEYAGVGMMRNPCGKMQLWPLCGLIEQSMNNLQDYLQTYVHYI